MDVTVSRVKQLKVPGNEIVVRLHFNEIEESITLKGPLSQAFLSDPLPENLKIMKNVKIVQWNKDKVLLKKVYLFGTSGQYVPFICDNES